MDDQRTFNFFDMHESDPNLEKHRIDVLEKYLEFGLISLLKAKEEGKTLDDIIDQTKTILWYVKNEFGL